VSDLQIRDLTVSLGGRGLLTSIDLDVGGGELVGLIGPNGAGKSTLVKAVTQLLPHAGSCRLDGQVLETLPARERACQLAYLAQQDTLQWPISVQDLVALGRQSPHGSWWGGPGQLNRDDREAVGQALQQTGIAALRTRRIDTLSGGERALARLARVLVVGAAVLLVDEPVAALDPCHQLEAMGLLRQECDRGAAVMVVLHDLTLASRFCDRLVLLDSGRIVAAGAVEKVLTERHLRQVYGIEAVVGEQRGERFIVPWKTAGGSTDGASSSEREAE